MFKKNKQTNVCFKAFKYCACKFSKFKIINVFLGNCNHGKCFKSILILRNMVVVLKACL